MTKLGYVWSASAALVALVLLPASARAQSAIAGTVNDATGAVLSGVTVEASSDVLTERSKAVVTDAQGNYKIVDLRPGTYSMTFSLEGFSMVKREAPELPSNFTATVNAELKVGALQCAAAALGWRAEPRTANPRRGISESARRGYPPSPRLRRVRRSSRALRASGGRRAPPPVEKR